MRESFSSSAKRSSSSFSKARAERGDPRTRTTTRTNRVSRGTVSIARPHILLFPAALLSLLCASLSHAERAEVRVRDDWFEITVPQPPAHAEGQGPIVALDHAHWNYHKLDRRYKMFGKLLEKDGSRVRPFETAFTKQGLEEIGILAIANALHEDTATKGWVAPTPSAFTPEEVAAVRQWVHDGGALLLIADHMPFPGAAADLGAAFGFTFHNAYAKHKETGSGWIDFGGDKPAALAKHPITKGRNADEEVVKVRCFAGQVFEIPEDAQPILIPDDMYEHWMTQRAGQHQDPKTPKLPVKPGSVQGAVLEYGKGRVAVFGEAMMFSVQGSLGRGFTGMYGKGGRHNAQFLLNVIHWLDRKL